LADFLSTQRFVSGPGTPGFEPIARLVLPPAPGDFDLGGLVDTLLQRFPIPRPRLPAPRGPTVPRRGPTGPFPIPIPFPDDILFGGADCPEQACCKGFHVAKTKDPNQPSFGKCVRNRRMNPLNPRALRRSTRRLASFDRHARAAKKELKRLCR